ncbi:MAG: GIY-YIG nuclease family protein [Firmicutes bacterium]|nr:GIY-YIG nuclease family protein [Bacillota bacterium]
MHHGDGLRGNTGQHHHTAARGGAPVKEWQVYIVRCRDGTLYTGCTNDLAKRIAAHNEGKGAKYTRSRRPVEMVYNEAAADRNAALRREAAIKKLRRCDKLALLRKTEDL